MNEFYGERLKIGKTSFFSEPLTFVAMVFKETLS